MRIVEAIDLRRDYTYFSPSKRGWLYDLLRPHKVTKPALQGVTFTIPEGQTTAIVGPNGSGKSTLVKLICGIIRPTSGELRVMGFEPFRQRQRLVRNLGVMFGQKSLLLQDLSLFDTLQLYQRVYRLSNQQFASRCELLQNYFGFWEFKDQPVRKLSLGQRMRGELVATLLHSPRFLILDEPSIGLDAEGRSRLADFLCDHKGELTTLLISHDADLLNAVDAKVFRMEAGRIQAALESVPKHKGICLEIEYRRERNSRSAERLISIAFRHQIRASNASFFIYEADLQQAEMLVLKAWEVTKLKTRTLTMLELSEMPERGVG